MITYRPSRPAPTLAAALLLLGSANLAAQIQFEDVSEATNMTGFTESWGASWGDLNADNWPDMFNQGHRDYPRVYRNTGTGTFEDIAYELDPGSWIADPFNDQHGVSFVDYDNDGDDDILISVSNTGLAQFLVNDGAPFTDRAIEADLDDDDGARASAWFDYTGDGNLDVAQVFTSGSFLRFRDPDGGSNPEFDFDDETNAGFSCPGRVNYGQLVDIDNDGSLEFFCIEEGDFPLRAWDVSTLPFTDVTTSVPAISNVNDTIVADFNNDLLSDIVLIRGATRPSGASLVGDFRVEAWLRKGETTPPPPEKGFSFESNGEITVTLDYRGLGVFDDPTVATLSPTGQTEVTGGPVRVEWVEAESRWRAYLRFSTADQAYIQIDTVEPITNLTEEQLDPPEFALETEHLVNDSVTGLARNFSTGLFVPKFCVSGVAADFDNDMDQDIYMVCRRGAENLSNRLFVNQGDGTFVEELAFGGEGPVGTGFSFGVGESVVTADYDVDGFVDLYVTNGLLFYPIGEGGPDTMLRNVGNGNNWLQFDLVGTTSNRDGVGAKIYVTANGVTQMREQNGGYHRWSQNHQRIHVGLADNATADVTIEWPSGTIDTYTDVAANALYDATEGGALTVATLGPPVFTELEAGDECGEPPYSQNYGPAVLLWKDCTTDLWSLRAKGGRFEEFLQFVAGRIRADAPFSEVAPFALGGDDSLDNATPEELLFSVGVWFANDQGFDFNIDGQTESCFEPDTLELPLIFGGKRKRIEPPFDLVTLGECSPPPPTDPACGFPEFDVGTENQFFIWRDCDDPGPDSQWRVRVLTGGVGAGTYAGRFTSETSVLSATPAFLESNDVLDSAPGDQVVDFALKLGNSGVDGFDFAIAEGETACFDVTQLAGTATVLLGADREVKTGPFDLATGEACVTPEPACGFPEFDLGTDNELFIWRDCAAPGPDENWFVRVTSGGVGNGKYIGALGSETAVLSATPAFLESSDVLDSNPGDGFIDFELKLGAGGADGFDFTRADGVDICFDVTELAGSAQVRLGANRQIMTGPFNLETLEACTVTPPQTDPSCGTPLPDTATDNELFIWRDCSAAGVDAQWKVRVTSGGVGNGSYEGTLTSQTATLAATPVFLESSDVLDSTPGDGTVDFELKLGSGGIDGFDFAVPDGADACFDVTQLAGSAAVVLGAERQPVSGALDLVTLEACN